MLCKRVKRSTVQVLAGLAAWPGSALAVVAAALQSHVGNEVPSTFSSQRFIYYEKTRDPFFPDLLPQ